MRNRIYVTREDMDRLNRLIEGLQASASVDRRQLTELQEELDRAEVLDSGEIPADVITMNSEVRLRDLDTGKIMSYRIVYPNTRSHGTADPLSVLAPLGTALLGYRAGDSITWPVPKGMRRLKVLQVVYQPESAGKPAA